MKIVKIQFFHYQNDLVCLLIQTEASIFRFSTLIMAVRDANINHSLENFIVCRLDATASEAVNIENLRQIVNLIKVFTNSDECIDYITDIRDENIFLVICDSLAKQILPHICDINQIKSIYVLSDKKTMYTKWTEHFKKICGVFERIDEIYVQLKSDVRKLATNLIGMSFLPTEEGNDVRKKNQQEVIFMYSQILKEIFIRMKNEQDDKKKQLGEVLIEYSYDPTFYPEFVERMRRFGSLPVDETQTIGAFCKKQYYDNQYQLKLIAEFEQNYNPSQCIWWYTRPSFLYEILNKALRIQDIDVLYNMRFFIVDLHNKLMELYSQSSHCSSLIVYRGQGVSNEELEKIEQSCGGLLSISNFLSTSTDKEVALCFALPHLNRPGYKAVLFEICVYPTTTIKTPYADISKESYFQGIMSENEILFSIGAVFRIHYVNKLNNGMWKVNITMTDDEDNELKELTKNKLEKFNLETNIRGIGRLLFETENYDKAEYFMQLQLKERLIRVNDKSHQELLERSANSFRIVGITSDSKYDYKVWSKNEYIYIASLYNDLGLIFYEKYDYDKALFYYNKLLEVFKDELLVENALKAVAYQNIALVYSDMEKYTDAMEKYKLALELLENCSDVSPLHLARLYYNIGSLFITMKHYHESMLWYEKALKIQLDHLPRTHPDIGLSYNGVGRIFAFLAFKESTDVNQQLLTEALNYMEKANYIFQKTLIQSHREVLKNQADIAFLKTFMK